MTRQEEIVNRVVKEQSQSQLYQPLEWRAGFIAGAKWADKTMLDRACEWFEPRLTALIGREDAEELITAFRQAMEGGAE